MSCSSLVVWAHPLLPLDPLTACGHDAFLGPVHPPFKDAALGPEHTGSPLPGLSWGNHLVTLVLSAGRDLPSEKLPSARAGVRVRAAPEPHGWGP